MHLAVSLVIRAAVQIARQTSQLHSIARAVSSSAGAFILAAATLIRSWLFAPSANPPPPATKIAASTMQPARLPDQEPIQEAARSRRFVRRRSHPRVMNIVLPVKRSEPAKMTRVNAIPNDAPMTIGRMLGSTFAPTRKIRMMLSPTPAIIELIQKPNGERRRNAALPPATVGELIDGLEEHPFLRFSRCLLVATSAVSRAR